MPRGLVVIGAGGFGREALDVAQAVNAVASSWELLGVMDDAPSDVNRGRLVARGIPYLGKVDARTLASEHTDVVIAVGSPLARSFLWRRLADLGERQATLIHPSAQLGSQCRVSPGTVICAGVIVGTNCRLGRAVHLNPHVTVGHDTVVKDFVSVNPGATVSGGCRIGRQVLLGAGSIILQEVTVADRAVVGAGAVCTRDVAAETVVMGVPAR